MPRWPQAPNAEEKIQLAIKAYPTVHSHPHYTLKKYAFYNKIYILRIISSFLQVYFTYMNLSWLYEYLK